MSQFPKAIKISDDVLQRRKKRLKLLLQTSFFAILLRSLFVSIEMTAAYFFGSKSLFVDALFSLIDISFSLLIMGVLYLAEKPPDQDHPFGHGRYEPLAALQMGFFLLFAGVWAVYQQILFLHETSSHVLITPSILLIPWLGVFFLEFAGHILYKKAKKEKSSALAADAFHYRVDALTTLIAGLSLTFGLFFPSSANLLDQIGGLVIAVFMIGVGFYSIRMSLPELMDQKPEEKYFLRVYESSMAVSGVLDIEKINIQLYGPDAHVNIDVEVDPKVTVEDAHKISQEVRAKIQTAWPKVRDVTVHIEPFYPNDHSPLHESFNRHFT